LQDIKIEKEVYQSSPNPKKKNKGMEYKQYTEEELQNMFDKE